VSLASISRIDTSFTSDPFIELSQRSGSSKSCTPQVRFSVNVHVWSEDGLLDGTITAHGYWTESPHSVRLEADGPLSSLGGSLAGTSGLPSNAFHFSFDLSTTRGSATLGKGSNAPRLFDWSAFSIYCRNGQTLPDDPALADPNAMSCGAITNFPQTPAATISGYLSCAKNALKSNTPFSIGSVAGGSRGATQHLFAPLTTALAKGRAPYFEIYIETAIAVPGPPRGTGEVRRCQTIAVNTSCDMTDGTQVVCLDCTSPGPWIPVCTLTPPM
jgi:hypothetical protein